MIHRQVSLLLASILVVAACGGGSGRSSSPIALESIGASPGQTPTPTPNVTGSATPTADPAARPSIAGSFAVANGSRQLALVCWGDGSPTVLLETGGDNIDEWTGTGMVRKLAQQTRVCTYDRAGTGASDPPPYERRDADDVVSDLKALLAAADIDGPYVLVGRSFGGMIVTYFAETVPREVVGVVVFDTPAPSATFTAESEPGLVWNYPDNTERLDVVGGFENRFAKTPPKVAAPVLVITPTAGEASAEDESFWLRVSPSSRQVVLPTESACVNAVVDFVIGLR